MQGGAAHTYNATQTPDYSRLSPAQIERRAVATLHTRFRESRHTALPAVLTPFPGWLAGWRKPPACLLGRAARCRKDSTRLGGASSPAFAAHRAPYIVACDSHQMQRLVRRAPLHSCDCGALSPVPTSFPNLQMCTSSAAVPATSGSSSIRQLWHAPAAEHGAPAGHWHGLRLTVQSVKGRAESAHLAVCDC